MVMESPLAAIDLGTNSARLLIAHIRPGSPLIKVTRKRFITRLGGGFTKDKGISESASSRTLEVMQYFASEIQKHNVSRVRAVATSAVRDAVNGRNFLSRILNETGITCEIIDGNEEGLLTLAGVTSGLGCIGNLVLFDIGGGSTEYVLAEAGKPLFTMSLPLGVVRLTEGKVSVAAMENKISRELENLANCIDTVGLKAFPSDAILVGTAGTATTLASVDLELIDIDYSAVHGHVMSLESIRRIYELLLPMSPEKRLTVPGMEKGREDLVIAGILLTIKTMVLFGYEHLTVCDTGLLEGLLLSMANS
jgi:exopolyphosphatase / guanosine-5'-triphosphate,3'-diphosphate pyrophosphatase